MCGIMGLLAEAGQQAAPVLLDGLRRLEYRGYDSAGVATLVNGHIVRRRAAGKLCQLERSLQGSPLAGNIGIAHTRWATHGAPTEDNAHPHATDRVAVVHNGIIENFRVLRRELIESGCQFKSETDTEVIPHLITRYLAQGLAPKVAAAEAIKRLEGAYALVIMFAGERDLLLGARRGSPLVVGVSGHTMYLASDAMALAPFTQDIAYLEDGDCVEINGRGFKVCDGAGAPAAREPRRTTLTAVLGGKGQYAHFMHKEIFEQPATLAQTLRRYCSPAEKRVDLPELSRDLANLPKLTMVACGSSYYACLVGKYWLEHIAGLPVEVDLASEFRYRATPLPRGGAALFVSQSGETADTLAALRHTRAHGQHILSVVNVAESSIARSSDVVFQTLAGPEIGVASTKAFTAQLMALACFALAVGRERGVLSPEHEAYLTAALLRVPSLVEDVLAQESAIRGLAQTAHRADRMFYISRGSCYPIALEGALKVKEIAYLPAEGYPAGELKHGPIALVDEHVPVVVLAPRDALFDKTASNLQEVAARRGQVVLLSDAAGVTAFREQAAAALVLPEMEPFVAPIIYTVAVQLLGYHIAVLRGTDIDQPRNLAKSVTVE
jgi:glutamine---fructose-6-phosphate transaminase (isomerizing)